MSGSAFNEITSTNSVISTNNTYELIANTSLRSVFAHCYEQTAARLANLSSAALIFIPVLLLSS